MIMVDQVCGNIIAARRRRSTFQFMMKKGNGYATDKQRL